MATVDTCWGPRKVHDNAFWHLVPATGGNAKMFYNNVRVGKGALFSVSAGIEAEPGIEQAQTPYSITRIYDEKERIFEEVRITRFPTRPSRLKTLYVFDDFQFVERAQSAWYSDEPKVAHKCHLLVGSVTYRADTFWLNSHQNKWSRNSHDNSRLTQ